MKGRAFVAGDRVTVADFIGAYTLDMGDVVGLLDGFPSLQAHLERMYARPRAPRRIDEIFRDMKSAAEA
jgi:glutathione S-transferase